MLSGKTVVCVAASCHTLIDSPWFNGVYSVANHIGLPTHWMSLGLQYSCLLIWMTLLRME